MKSYEGIEETPMSSTMNSSDDLLFSLHRVYDAGLKDLRQMIYTYLSQLLVDTDKCVKIELLDSMDFYCQFFGRQKSNELILSHVVTYMNEKYWELRS